MATENKIKVLLTKIGLDTHITGVRVVAQILRDAGMEIVYLGKYQSPEAVVEAAIQEDVDVIGISDLGLSYHLILDVMRLLKEKRRSDILVVAGGSIPRPQVSKLKSAGVSEVFGPGSSSEAIVRHIVSYARKTTPNVGEAGQVH